MLKFLILGVVLIDGRLSLFLSLNFSIYFTFLTFLALTRDLCGTGVVIVVTHISFGRCLEDLCKTDVVIVVKRERRRLRKDESATMLFLAAMYLR